MPHIDDGIMHAYLDGALHALSDAGELPDGMSIADVTSHLSACADCRARLEAERGIREQAGLVLRDVAPVDVTVPPFGDVAGAAVVQTRRQTRWIPLTWAATVLFAVGAGWWGSAIWRGQGMGEMAATDQAQSRAVASTPDPVVLQRAAEAGVASDDGTSSDVAAGSDAANTGVAEVDASDPDALASNAAQARARQAVESMTDMSVTAAPQAARADGRVDTEIVVAEAPLPFRPTTISADAGADVRREAARDAPPTEPIGNAIGKVTIAESFEAGVADDFGTFAGMLAREQAGRMQFVRVRDDSDAVHEQVFIVADASAPVIEVAEEIGQTTVRVRQTLPSGESVEVVTWELAELMLDQVVVTGFASRDSGRDTVAVRLRAEARALLPRSAQPPPAPPPAAQQSRADSGMADAFKVLSAPAAPAFLVSTEPPRTLPDGRRELVLRSASGPLWMAIRADLPPAALLDLVPQLTRAAAPARQ